VKCGIPPGHEAPVYIEFNPSYRDADVLEWRRIETNQFYKQPDCGRLQSLASEEKITHAVLESAPEGGTDALACDFTREVYRDGYYRIYALE
jgi:hypothetical protein